MAIQNRRGADADFDPNKVLPGEFGFTTDGSRKVYAAFAPNDVKEVAFKEDVPTKTSDLANDTGFVTKTVSDLINYYTKSETYTQEEINQLVSTIPKFSIQPVPELPTEKISTTTVYLLTTGEESQNLYTEYIYVNGAWEKLGTQKLDLSGYALNSDIPTKLSELINDTEFITAAVDNLVNYYTKKEMEERLYEKANSIISTRTGTVVVTTDSAKAKPKNIKLFGKSEQDGIPSMETSIVPVHHGESGSIGGKVYNKNFLKNIATTQTINGVAFTVNSDGTVVANGTATASASLEIQQVNPALPKGEFILNGCPSGGGYDKYFLEYSNYTDFSYQDYGNYVNGVKMECFDYDKYNNCHINIFVMKGTTVTNLLFKPMISIEGEEFEPYKEEQPFTALTPNGLPGIPLGTTIPDVIKNSPIHMSGVYWDNATSQYYIGDTVEFESGEYVQRIIEFGVEDFKYISVSDDSKWYDSNLSYSYELKTDGLLDNCYAKDMSTHFTGYGFNEFYNAGVENGCLTGQSYIVVNISKSYGICTTVDEFKQWCIGNGVKFYKILANPIITDLTQEELDQYNALLMNYPNTTVVNDAGAYMEVEYVADTKEHIKQNYVAKSEHEALKNRVSEIENVIANL